MKNVGAGKKEGKEKLAKCIKNGVRGIFLSAPAAMSAGEKINLKCRE